MAALLWDMNGVLVDDEPLQQEAWKETLEAANLYYDPDWWVKHFLGRRASTSLAKVMPELSEEERSAIIIEKRQRYNEIAAAHLPVGPGSLEMLEAARLQGIVQALVSSNNPEAIDLVIDRLGTRHYFAAIVSGTDVKVSKPHPECFLLAAKQLNEEPEECWVIEDSLFGIEAAHAANMRCVALTTSLSAHALSHAEIVVDTLSAELLEQLLDF